MRWHLILGNQVSYQHTASQPVKLAVLKGHGFSRAVSTEIELGLQALRDALGFVT